MGVYIPNMKMPKSCWDCELLSSCKAMPKNPTADEIGIYTIMRLKDCPLIEIPQEDEKAVLFLLRMRKATREGKSWREFLDEERRTDE